MLLQKTQGCLHMLFGVSSMRKKNEGEYNNVVFLQSSVQITSDNSCGTHKV